MTNWTIGKRVIAVCGVLIALVVFAGAAGLLGMSKMKGTVAGLNENYVASLVKLGQLESLVFELRGTSFMSALPSLSPEERSKQLAKAEEVEAKIQTVLKSYETPGAITAEERPMFDQTNAGVTAFAGALATFRQTAAVNLKEAVGTYERDGVPKREALRKLLEAELKYNDEGLVASVNSVSTIGQSYSGITWLILMLAFCSGTVLCVFIVRSINSSLQVSTSEIRSSAGEVTSASAQVASASEKLAQGASQQAASLQETSASGQEISAMTQRNAENSRTAAGLMTEVDQRVTLANKKLEQMVISMGEITHSSERIAKIIKVIDEIAFQTNILALNAAVEAARAGEAGLGFAVVADEVRNLAQRCAQAAKDTTSLIEESVNNARTGGSRLDEVADVIRGITESAVKVKTLVDEVSHGGLEQARGIDQISRALVQMEQTTQQSAASAQESASASQQLKAQAASMEQIVLSLEALISQPAAAHSPARIPVHVAPIGRKPVIKAPVRSVKVGLLPLQKAVGTSRPISQPTAQPVMAASSMERNSFPLDDSEFKEF